MKNLPSLVPEFDGAIIAHLPDEGAKVGIRPLGLQVKSIALKLNEPGVGGTQVGPRMRALHEHGYVKRVQVFPLAGGAGWQRTQAGKDWAREHGHKVP